MPTWLSPSLHFSFVKKTENNKKKNLKHMESNLLSGSLKKNRVESETMRRFHS